MFGRTGNAAQRVFTHRREGAEDFGMEASSSASSFVSDDSSIDGDVREGIDLVLETEESQLDQLAAENANPEDQEDMANLFRFIQANDGIPPRTLRRSASRCSMATDGVATLRRGNNEWKARALSLCRSLKQKMTSKIRNARRSDRSVLAPNFVEQSAQLGDGEVGAYRGVAFGIAHMPPILSSSSDFHASSSRPRRDGFETPRSGEWFSGRYPAKMPSFNDFDANACESRSRRNGFEIPRSGEWFSGLFSADMPSSSDMESLPRRNALELPRSGEWFSGRFPAAMPTINETQSPPRRNAFELSR